MSRFIKDDWVTCINASLSSGDGLTVCKDYRITKDDNLATLIFITNDYGKEDCYHYTRFTKSLNSHKVTIPMFSARMKVINAARKLSVGDIGVKVEWIETGVGYLVFRLVSELFHGVEIPRRHAKFDQTLAEYAPPVMEEYDLIYDAVTPKEEMMGMEKYY